MPYYAGQAPALEHREKVIGGRFQKLLVPQAVIYAGSNNLNPDGHGL